MGETLLQGKLAPFGLLPVVQLLCESNLAGRLQVYEMGVTFTIYLADGHIVAASSSDGVCVGESLLNKGVISQQQYDKVMELQTQARRLGRCIPAGRILLNERWVDEDELEQSLFSQVIETLVLCLELPNPHFRFSTIDSLDDVDLTAFVDFHFALLEAFRIVDSLQRGES